MQLASFRRDLLLFTCSYFVLYYIVIFCNIQVFNDYSDIIELFGQVISLPVFFYCAVKHPKHEKLPWALFFICALTYLMGDAIWAYLNHMYGTEPETPSICDFFYIFNTVLCVIGVLLYLRIGNEINIASISIDLFISFFALVGLVFFLLIQPIIEDKELEFSAKFVSVLYPMGDIASLSAFMLLLFNVKTERFLTSTNKLLALSIFTAAVADLVSLLLDMHEIDLGHYLDPLWSCVYLILAIGGLYNLAPKEEYVESNNVYILNKIMVENTRVLLPYLITFSLLIFVGVKYELYNAIFIWAIILILLLSFRQVFIILKNRALLLRIQQKEQLLNLKNVELKQLNEKIMRDAQIDFLTQLSNRRCIEQAFEELKPKAEQPEALGVLLIDVDYFKKINDTYGHQVGDTVLQKVAEKIRESIRANDIAGRYGGDEFIVLLPGASEASVFGVASRVQEQIRADQSLQNWKVTLSIGASSWAVSRQDYEVSRLLRMADTALYQAKEHGRDQIRMAPSPALASA